jgi:hypothetical protein
MALVGLQLHCCTHNLSFTTSACKSFCMTNDTNTSSASSVCKQT